MKAVLLISHGSHSPKTKQEVSELVSRFKKESGVDIFEYAFLEIEEPSIPTGIAICVEKGAQEIIILQNFLNSGKHVDQDIPAIIEEAQKKYPNVSMQITNPVGQHKRIADLFLDMISESKNGSD